GLFQSVAFVRVVGQQVDSGDAELCQHFTRDAVVAFVLVEAQNPVGFNGVQPVVLKLVGTHLVGRANAASLLRQIEQGAAAALVEGGDTGLELRAAVATQAAEKISREAGRVHSDGNRVWPIPRL